MVKSLVILDFLLQLQLIFLILINFTIFFYNLLKWIKTYVVQLSIAHDQRALQ